jgi:hypothetical protein
MSSRPKVREMSQTGGYPFVAETARWPDKAKVFWRPDWDKSVLVVKTAPAHSAENAFDIHAYGAWANVLIGEDGVETVLLSDGVHRLQIVILEGSVLSGPVYLRYMLGGFKYLDLRILSLRRLIGLHQNRRFMPSLYPKETKALRWVDALRAYDGYRSGASQREIAVAVFGKSAVEEDWNGRSDFLRLRVQRLLTYARGMVEGGYGQLLK